MGGEPRIGQTPEGVEDELLGVALVGEDAAVVDLGDAGDVPGVGGLAGAALADVAGEPLEGGGAEEVGLGPGAALDALDGAGPGVGAVGGSVGSPAFNERPGDCGAWPSRCRSSCSSVGARCGRWPR